MKYISCRICRARGILLRTWGRVAVTSGISRYRAKFGRTAVANEYENDILSAQLPRSRGGSDSPPDCHSFPPRFESPILSLRMGWDSILGRAVSAVAKIRRLTLPRSRGGSDSPPDCHSFPPRFESHFQSLRITTAGDNSPAVVIRRGWDSNPCGVAPKRFSRNLGFVQDSPC